MQRQRPDWCSPTRGWSGGWPEVEADEEDVLNSARISIRMRRDPGAVSERRGVRRLVNICHRVPRESVVDVATVAALLGALPLRPRIGTPLERLRHVIVVAWRVVRGLAPATAAKTRPLATADDPALVPAFPTGPLHPQAELFTRLPSNTTSLQGNNTQWLRSGFAWPPADDTTMVMILPHSEPRVRKS